MDFSGTLLAGPGVALERAIATRCRMPVALVSSPSGGSFVPHAVSQRSNSSRLAMGSDGFLKPPES